MSMFGKMPLLFNVNKRQKTSPQDEITVYINVNRCPQIEVAFYHGRHLSDFTVNCTDDISVKTVDFNRSTATLAEATDDEIPGSAYFSAFTFNVPKKSSGLLSFTAFGVTTPEIKWEYVDDDTTLVYDFDGNTLYRVGDSWRSDVSDSIQIDDAREFMLSYFIRQYRKETDDVAKVRLISQMVKVLVPRDPYADQEQLKMRMALAEEIVQTRIVEALSQPEDYYEEEEYEDEDEDDFGYNIEDLPEINEDFDIDILDKYEDDDDEGGGKH